MKPLEKVMLCLQAAATFCVLIYSYAFVDLNLTLNQNPQVLSFVNSLQQIGYYQRPASTIIYVVLLTLTFTIFITNLLLFSKNKLSKKYLFVNIFISTGVLMFSYPFLSSDLFNYMFDAKILGFYHQSPYAFRALDFPNDDWVRFMRWVHRYSPYGPLWLALSLIPTAIGFGKFITTFFAFKIIIAAFHIANSYLIYKILQIIDKKNSRVKTALYALNPLFLIEGVINAHNDLVMVSPMLASVLFAITGKKILSYLTLILSTLIKYISAINFPWLVFFQHMDKSRNVKRFIYLNIVSMAAFTVIFSTIGITVPFVSTTGLQIQFQPWYLFWTIPFVVLIANRQTAILIIILCASASLRYLPYILHGDWSQPGTIEFMRNITFVPTLIIATVFLIKKWLPRTQ